jgi:hypothetical protein
LIVHGVGFYDNKEGKKEEDEYLNVNLYVFLKKRDIQRGLEEKQGKE